MTAAISTTDNSALGGDPPESGASAARMTPREVMQALSGLMLGMFVSILASTVVSNALPRIIADLQGTQSVYTWIVTTELLAMTATVPLWGKMADLYNKKLLIQLSLGLFTTGSIIAGFTPKKAKSHKTRSARLPASTDPTSWPMPCAIAGLIVYLAM